MVMLIPVLMYGREVVMWKEKSSIRAIQMDNLRGLLGIKEMGKVPNTWIRKLCGVTKGLMKVFSDG